MLDGIPESIVLGLALLSGEGVSVAILAAVFLSNLPESMAATTGFARSGHSRTFILTLWTAIVAVSGLASLAGYALFDTAGDKSVAFVLAFAGGAVLTMLTDTMVPEAVEHGQARGARDDVRLRRRRRDRRARGWLDRSPGASREVLAPGRQQTVHRKGCPHQRFVRERQRPRG